MVYCDSSAVKVADFFVCLQKIDRSPFKFYSQNHLSKLLGHTKSKCLMDEEHKWSRNVSHYGFSERTTWMENSQIIF